MDFQSEYYKLDNGVRVLEIPMEGVESVASLVLVRTGSRNEMPEQAGISHVLEHMVFKGTEKYPTPLSLAEVVDGMGAEFNAFTGKEYTGYYIKSAGNHIDTALNVLGEMLIKPKLRQDDLDREKGVIIEEINMYEDLPIERAEEEFENLLFAGDLGRLIIGEKKTVSAVTSEDLRAYMDRWYRGSNILVVVVGKTGNAKSAVNRVFGEILKKKEFDAYVSRGVYGMRREFKLKKDTEQAHFVVGVPGLRFDDERRYAMNMLRIVLGGNMSSRLFTEIREKRGWAYYVKAVKQEYFDVGYLGVRAGVKLGACADAIEVVKREMLGIGKSITEAELAKAKEYFKGVFTLSLEDPLGVAKFAGEAALILNKLRDPNEIMEGVEGVTIDEVRSIANELLREEKLRTAIVGPASI